jgi:hypothetical protein
VQPAYLRLDSVNLLQEIAMLRANEADIIKHLCFGFENYYSLDENTHFGVLEGGRVSVEAPAPALRPAVELTGDMQSLLNCTGTSIIDQCC